MRVEIYGPSGMTVKNLKPKGNEIPVYPSKDKNVASQGVKFESSDVVTYQVRLFFFLPWPKRTIHKVMLIENADKCFSLYYSAQQAKDLGLPVELPVYTRKQENDLAKANILKSSGNISSRMQIPFPLYALIGTSVVLGIMILAVQTGRLKI